MHPNPAFRKLFPGETHEDPYLPPEESTPEPFVIGLLPVMFIAFCLFVFFIAIFQYYDQTSNRIHIIKNGQGQWERVK